MKTGLMLAAALILPGCGDAPQAAPARQVEAVKPMAAPACTRPKLDFSAAPNLAPNEQVRFTTNFRVAFDKACAGKLFADQPLIDESSTDRSTLFVLNAPEANVTSIYLGTTAGPPPRMLIESPFGDPPQIPSVDDLHESIYCAVIGATEEEQETSGRCLPD